jgi:hypothetical protein
MDEMVYWEFAGLITVQHKGDVRRHDTTSFVWPDFYNYADRLVPDSCNALTFICPTNCSTYKEPLQEI